VPFVPIVVQKKLMKKILTLILLTGTLIAQSQVVYEHISRRSIYDFLDELANAQIIEVNSAIKPYSRAFIAEKLRIASEDTGQLSKRQQQELEFFMKDYRLELKPGTKGMKPLNLFPKANMLPQPSTRLDFITKTPSSPLLSGQSGALIITRTRTAVLSTAGADSKHSPTSLKILADIPAFVIITKAIS
jgi:hypothetical protein